MSRGTVYIPIVNVGIQDVLLYPSAVLGTLSNDESLLVAWTEECERSFEGLKSRLVSAPVLAYANFSLPFILEVDASYGGFKT